jgi:hypothetical protein
MTTDDDHTRRRQAIEEWWDTLSAQERRDAKGAVEAGTQRTRAPINSVGLLV